MKRTVLLLGSLLLLAATPSKLQVSEAWVRESNPARNITAAFMTLSNPTAKPIVVTGAVTPAAKVVEIHEMKTVDGVMTMQRIDSVTVPAKGKVTLEPGGIHLMLIDLTARARAGTAIPITLKTADGAELQVTAPVKNPDSQPQHAH